MRTIELSEGDAEYVRLLITAKANAVAREIENEEQFILSVYEHYDLGDNVLTMDTKLLSVKVEVQHYLVSLAEAFAPEK